MRLLIVEDETLVALSLKMELENLGHIVCDTIASGENAIKFMQSQTADVILMDISLSGTMDGIQAAAHIRKLSDTPVIFMTGYANKANDDDVVKLDPVGFLIKPISLRKLQYLLDSILE
ncbi:MAG: response regulator [Spirochaetaceae bacterium]|nr:response regulator [Spirochaetaceae bacterium]MCF7951498.1 response regulator [Spirochaetaceae bacterium]